MEDQRQAADRLCPAIALSARSNSRRTGTAVTVMSVKSVKTHSAQFSPLSHPDRRFLAKGVGARQGKSLAREITDFTATTDQPAPRRGQNSRRQMIRLKRK